MLGESIKINSGIRCSNHNAAIKASSTSSHVGGWAADLECSTSSYRYRLLKEVLQVFDRVGISGSFIHVDVDATKNNRLIWTY